MFQQNGGEVFPCMVLLLLAQAQYYCGFIRCHFAFQMGHTINKRIKFMDYWLPTGTALLPHSLLFNFISCCCCHNGKCCAVAVSNGFSHYTLSWHSNNIGWLLRLVVNSFQMRFFISTLWSVTQKNPFLIHKCCVEHWHRNGRGFSSSVLFGKELKLKHIIRRIILRLISISLVKMKCTNIRKHSIALMTWCADYMRLK